MNSLSKSKTKYIEVCDDLNNLEKILTDGSNCRNLKLDLKSYNIIKETYSNSNQNLQSLELYQHFKRNKNSKRPCKHPKFNQNTDNLFGYKESLEKAFITILRRKTGNIFA